MRNATECIAQTQIQSSPNLVRATELVHSSMEPTYADSHYKTWPKHVDDIPPAKIAELAMLSTGNLIDRFEYTLRRALGFVGLNKTTRLVPVKAIDEVINH